jgi:hypothetical protein
MNEVIVMVLLCVLAPPSPPQNVQILAVTSKSVTLQWSPPKSTGGAQLTGYIIEKQLVGTKTWEKIVTLETSVTQHVITNLKEKSQYVFRVFAENSMGLSQPAATMNVTLKTHASKESVSICILWGVSKHTLIVLAPPSAPTSPLECRQIGLNEIIIEWGIPESDGGAPIEGYVIAIRDMKKTMWMEVGQVNHDVQKLTVRELQDGHEYMLRIFARNEIGLGEPLESEEPIKICNSRIGRCFF